MRCSIFPCSVIESDTAPSLVQPLLSATLRSWLPRVHPTPHPDVCQTASICRGTCHGVTSEQVCPAQQPGFVIGQLVVEPDDLVGLLTGQVHAPLRAAQAERCK